ncbi:hypothetical protein NFI96_001505 [Prochilodus magdalenae]|nr:hypothetical protein NFI96_001505 [Prochilodus magdalenae]
MLAEVVKKLRTAVPQPTAHDHAGPGDVECDICTSRKRKAVKSCLKQVLETQNAYKQRIQEREEEHKELIESMASLKQSAQRAVQDTETVFRELVQSIERKCSEMTEAIRVQEKDEFSRAENQLVLVDQEIVDLKRKYDGLQPLCHAEDDFHYLQIFQSFQDLGLSESFPRVKINMLHSSQLLHPNPCLAVHLQLSQLLNPNPFSGLCLGLLLNPSPCLGLGLPPSLLLNPNPCLGLGLPPSLLLDPSPCSALGLHPSQLLNPNPFSGLCLGLLLNPSPCLGLGLPPSLLLNPNPCLGLGLHPSLLLDPSPCSALGLHPSLLLDPSPCSALGLHPSLLLDQACSAGPLLLHSCMVNMGKTKKHSKVIRDEIVEGHKAGKGYKTLSKELGLPVSTIGSIIRKWKAYGTTVNHPRPGQPFKVSSRAEARLVRIPELRSRLTQG